MHPKMVEYLHQRHCLEVHLELIGRLFKGCALLDETEPHHLAHEVNRELSIEGFILSQCHGAALSIALVISRTIHLGIYQWCLQDEHRGKALPVHFFDLVRAARKVDAECPAQLASGIYSGLGRTVRFSWLMIPVEFMKRSLRTQLSRRSLLASIRTRRNHLVWQSRTPTVKLVHPEGDEDIRGQADVEG